VPRAATTPGLDAGTKAEVRVAQAWFWDGIYVRRGVDLQHRFGPDVSTVTDLDVLGYTPDSKSGFRKSIGEVKTGRSNNTPKPLDRALWMRGVRELVGADSGEVTTAFRVSDPARDLCRRLGVTVQHMDDLATRERRLEIASVEDTGAHGETIALVRDRVAKFAKKDPLLERAWWFLVSEVWFLEPFDALKRTLGVVRELGRSWPPDAHADAMEAARWFFAECISIITLNLAVVAGEANSMSRDAFRRTAMARLATGDLPFHGVQKLSERVDVFVGKVLSSLNAPAEVITSTIGAFAPVPPDYAEPLLDLIDRLAAEAASTATLPRLVDVVMFERLVRRRIPATGVLTRVGHDPDAERLMRLVAAFLRGQFKLPGPVDKAMTTPLELAPTTAPPTTTQRATTATGVGNLAPDLHSEQSAERVDSNPALFYAENDADERP